MARHHRTWHGMWRYGRWCIMKELDLTWQEKIWLDMTWHDFTWWYNIIRHDLSWHDNRGRWPHLSWHDSSCHDVIRHDLTWYDELWHRVTLHDIIWQDMTLYEVISFDLKWQAWRDMIGRDLLWPDVIGTRKCMTWLYMRWCDMVCHDTRWLGMTWRD